MKKMCTAIWGLLLCFLLCLAINFFANETFVKHYKEGTYKENNLSVLGFLEPHISYYNKGNVYYQKGQYEDAIACYENALSRHPSKEQECDIRINLALSMIAPIDSSQLDEQELERAIATLKDAKEILCKNGCASENGDGHNKDAQTLKEDIDRFLNELKNQQNSSSKSSDKSDQNNKKNKEEPLENKDSIEEQLKEIQKQTNKEREQSMSDLEELSNFEFYDGQNW